MKPKIEMVIDSETLSENSLEATVVDFSAMIIDANKMISDSPYTVRDIVKVKKFKLNTKEQTKVYKTLNSARTLEFWNKQPPEVIKMIKPADDDLSVVDFVKQFNEFIGSDPSIKRIWCRNPAFDFINLKRLYSYAEKNIDDYIPFYTYRDMRTMIDTAFNFSDDYNNNFCPIKDEEFWNKVFKPHNSTWDVIADVLRYQAILRTNNDMEMIDR